MSDSFDVKSSIYAQKNKVHNLNEKHQNELEKIKVDHGKKKAALRHQHQENMVNVRNEQHREMLEQAHRQEKTLEKMKESLEETKKLAETKEKTVKGELDKNLEATKIRYQERMVQERSRQEMAIVEANQQANFEMDRLQRELEARESQVKRKSRADMQSHRSLAKSELSMEKNTFLTKKNATEDKYVTSLARQKKNHTDTIANEERKFQKALNARTSNYQRQLGKIRNDGDTKKELQKARFEKEFAKQIKTHEKKLADLKGKKEEIVQDLRNEIIEAYKLDKSRSIDPFYTTTTLDPKIEREGNDYLIKINVSREDAEAIRLNAHKREITLNFNRRFENTRNDDGAVENLRKIETLTRKFTVDEIVDPNKLEKSYENGILTFKLALA